MKTFEDYRYAAFHKPTKSWVLFENRDWEMNVVNMKLVEFKDCSILKLKDNIETILKASNYNGTKNYGNENFLEFDIVKIKCLFTLEP